MTLPGTQFVMVRYEPAAICGKCIELVGEIGTRLGGFPELGPENSFDAITIWICRVSRIGRC